MDFLLADRYHVSKGEEQHYAETVLRMPHGYACYSPPDDAPEVSSLPALDGSSFTFGCFNNPAKFSPRMLDAWVEILRRVPTSRLLLKYTGLDQPHMQQRIHDHFARRDVDSSRIVFEGRSPLREFLTAYQHVDLALDTQPYSGGLTTCEALWMGVPVVTLAGDRHASRVSASLLTAAGHPEWIAQTPDDYVTIAARLAASPETLSNIRATLRDDLRRSPLLDHAAQARRFADALLQCWQTRPTATPAA